MSSTAPFLLSPHLAERVWGGDRFGVGIGEAWDLSVHPNGHSVVASGPHRGRSLAEVVAERPADFGGPIELLAKRLDCAATLSVQVHPRTGDPKTEAWVVLGAEPGAGVYLGFADAPDPDAVRSAANDGSLADLLAFRELAVGDAVLVPAGTVHAIGGGLTLFELQQSSDTTYRLFDWGRSGRELHLDEALGCAVLAPAPEPQAPVVLADGVIRLIECPYFSIEWVDAPGPVTVAPGHRWSALHVVSGTARARELTVSDGDTLMVPASAGPIDLEPDAGFAALRYGPPAPG
ncbi:MAG: type I phosphomannose isomerase catalytic subunit [Acidimicrobiales bacterium]